MMFPIALLFGVVINGVALCELSDIILVTKYKGEYKRKITWTVEKFLDMPYFDDAETYYYSKDEPYFRSQRFPPNPENGVKWSFRFEFNDYPNKRYGFGLFLDFHPPSNVSSLTGTCQCSKTKDFRDESAEKVTRSNSFSFENFVTQAEMDSNKKEWLPNGQLTVSCIVQGELKLDRSNTEHRLPTEFVTTTQCGKQIASDSASKIGLRFPRRIGESKQDVFVSATGKEFHFQKDILFARAPGLKMNNNDSKLSLSDLSDKEMQDFLNFALKGTADNLEETCPKLYKVAGKYGFDCLKLTCNEVMRT